MGKKKSSEDTRTEEQKARDKAKRDEERKANFVRLAKHRTNKAIQRIEQLIPLAGAAYISTAEQRDKVVAALLNSVEKVQNAFSGTKSESEEFDF